MKSFKKIISGMLSASMILTIAIGGTSASASTYRMGDINADGETDITDLTHLSMFLNGRYGSADEYSTIRLDVNLDGIIDFRDQNQLTEIVMHGDTTGTITYNTFEHDVINQNTVEYKKYNVQTRTYDNPYTLEPVYDISSISTCSVGVDDREVDYSQSGVVRINYGFSNYYTTGFVVGRHTILTAAHCINGAGIDPRPISITLFNNDGTEFDTYDIQYLHYPANYSDEFGTVLDSGLDYGLITVNENLTSRKMKLGVSRGNMTVTNPLLYVTGYPVDNPVMENGHYNMVTGEGYLSGDKVSDKYLDYDIFTSGGQSGGPVYVKDSDCVPIVVGIHRGGWGIVSKTGVRITTDILQFVYNNPNIT